MNQPRRPAPTPSSHPAAGPRTDLPRATLGVLCIAGLILAAFWLA